MAKKVKKTVKKKLTPKQERFCQEYIIDLNATQAAIRAKYSKKTAYSQGQRLLKNVEVDNRLKVLQGEFAKETGISIKMVADGFKKIAIGVLSKELTNKHKLRAYENLGKHVGFYKEDNEQSRDLSLTEIAALMMSKNE